MDIYGIKLVSLDMLKKYISIVCLTSDINVHIFYNNKFGQM